MASATAQREGNELRETTNYNKPGEKEKKTHLDWEMTHYALMYHIGSVLANLSNQSGCWD